MPCKGRIEEITVKSQYCNLLSRDQRQRYWSVVWLSYNQDGDLQRSQDGASLAHNGFCLLKEEEKELSEND